MGPVFQFVNLSQLLERGRLDHAIMTQRRQKKRKKLQKIDTSAFWRNSMEHYRGTRRALSSICNRAGKGQRPDDGLSEKRQGRLGGSAAGNQMSLKQAKYRSKDRNMGGVTKTQTLVAESVYTGLSV